MSHWFARIGRQATSSSILLPTAHQRAFHPPRALFSTGTRVGLVRRTAGVNRPRWINSKHSPSDSEDNAGEKETEKENEKQEDSEETDSEKNPEKSEESATSESSTSSPASPSSSSASSSSSSSRSLAKPQIPEVYPHVLALPIARRPLFPGFYKAVVIRNPSVVAAIKDMMKRGQPYIGAFLLKDETEDSDIITDLSKVHDVGVFAQITSVFAANSAGKDQQGGLADGEEALTAVLYPHRRIRITELLQAGGEAKVVPIEEAQESNPPPSPSPEAGTFLLVLVR